MRTSLHTSAVRNHEDKTITPDDVDIFEEEQIIDDEVDTWYRSGTIPSSADQAEVVSRIEEAVKHESVDYLLKGLLELGGVAVVSNSLFTSALNIVCSEAAFGDLLQQHMTIRQFDALSMRVRPMNKVVREYVYMVRSLAHERRTIHRARLTVKDYGFLLRAAYLAGNDEFAETVWFWMKQDQLAPSLSCYTGYLGARVWNDLLPRYRMMNRVTPFYLLARDNPKAGYPFDNFKIREGGIKETTLAVFSRLRREGIQPNEELICHVMVALAREGDLKGVQVLMFNMWGIDANKIMSDDEQPPKQFDSQSQLFPSRRLLYTIIFCYSINDKLPTGLRVVDYISRHYGVTITEDVWDRVLNWASVLSIKRKNGADASIDKAAVLQIWETMQLPPYEVKPTLTMHMSLVRTYMHYGLSKNDSLVASLAGVHDIYRKKKRDLDKLWAAIRYTNPHDRLAHFRIEKIQRQLDETHLARARCSVELRRWIKHMLALTRRFRRTHWHPDLNGERFLLRDIPAMAGSGWRFWFPTRLQYYVPTGHVEIKIRTDRHMLDRHTSIRKQREAQLDYLNEMPRLMGHKWVHNRYRNHRLIEADTCADRSLSLGN